MLINNSKSSANKFLKMWIDVIPGWINSGSIKIQCITSVPYNLPPFWNQSQKQEVISFSKVYVLQS